MNFILANTQKDENGLNYAAHFTMPVTANEIVEAVKEMRLERLEKGNFKIIGTEFNGMDELAEFIPYEDFDFNELNLLAYKLQGYDEEKFEEYIAIVKKRGCNDLKNLINETYNLELNRYAVWGDENFQDVGRHYVENKYPDLDGIITKNLNYEGVGVDVRILNKGDFTDVGFVCNLYEAFGDIYTGNNLKELLEREVLANEQEQEMQMH